MAVSAALGAWPGLVQAGIGVWTWTNGTREFWGLMVLGTVLLGCWLSLQGLRFLRIRRRGPLYVVREVSDEWDREVENLADFVAQADTLFPAVRVVPGPATLYQWGWSLDASSARWEKRIRGLLTSFRIVRTTTEPAPTLTIVVWAWWSVALSIAARIRHVHAGKPVRVCPRDSATGRSGSNAVDLRHVIAFEARPEIPPTGDLSPYTAAHFAWFPVRGRRALLEVTAVTHEVRLKRVGGRKKNAATSPGVRILLIRATNAPWGELSVFDPPPTAVAKPEIRVRDFAGLGLASEMDCQVEEWRSVLPPGRFFDSREMAVLAQAVVTWVSRTLQGAGEAICLLGAAVPQELAAGIGILAYGQDSGWPRHLYPLQYDVKGEVFVIPCLDLGFQALRATGVPGQGSG
jgi:hypothetical protein